MSCSDPRLTYLNSYGYNVVKLPRDGIGPLQVIGKDRHSIEDLGSLSTIWKSAQPEPKTHGPNVAANINGGKTDNLKLSIGLDILGSILQGMGASDPKVNGAFSHARSVQFTFTGVTETLVTPLEVGAYLSAGDLDTTNPFASYLLDPNKHAYVVTSVLESDSIIVTARHNSDASIAADIPSIQTAVGVDVSVSASGANNEDVTFKGTEPLTFGFKMFGITYSNGHWHVFGEAPSAGGALARSAPLLSEFNDQPIVIVPGALLSELKRKRRTPQRAIHNYRRNIPQPA